MHAHIAGKLTGRITKWIVLVVWLVLMGTVGALSSKLIDVQNNEASSWLPESAESTEVLEELSDTVDPNDIPTLVVYNKESGLTDEDLAAMDEQAQEMAKIDGVTDQGALSPNVAAAAQEQGQPGPQLLSEDGQVAYIYLVFNFGENGWNDIPDAVDEIREIADIDGVTVHMAGFGGQAADSAEAFEGIDTNLILITLLVVIVILLFTYRSPILWLLPIISAVVAYSVSGGVVYLLAKYADLTVNGQSQAIMGILVIGAGTDYALLLTARYREELRRHEDRHEAMAFALHRAAPAILASAATVAAGMLCLIVADLNSTAGLGPVNAVAVAITYLVMVTSPPGSAGDLRPLDLLAQAPRLRHARADEHRVLGEGRQRHPAASPQGVDGHHRHPAALLPRPVQARPVRAVDGGAVHQGVRLDQGADAAHRPRSRGQLQHRADRHQHRRASRGRGGDRRGRRPGRAHAGAGHRQWSVLLRGHDRGGRLIDRCVRHRREHPRCGPRRRAAPMPWSAAARRSGSIPRPPPSATTR